MAFVVLEPVPNALTLGVAVVEKFEGVGYNTTVYGQLM